MSYIADQELPIYGNNCFHFYSVANALATRIYKENHPGDLESDQPIFNIIKGLRTRHSERLKE
jgi:hypothetical protein